MGRMRTACPGRGPDPFPWPAGSEAEAVAEQERLRPLVDLVSAGPPPEAGCRVAGVDVAYDDRGGRVAAGAVVLELGAAARTGTALPAVVEQATAVSAPSFPYVPGLLAFRELPSVLQALTHLARAPDVVVCDGYGIAHPRRVGLASHLGVLTGIPSFGVAKTPFSFSYDEPGRERGAWTPLVDGGEVVGRALRTQTGVRPVFVSVGHAIGLAHACAYTLRLSPHHRLPETTRQADRLCRRALAGEDAHR